MINFCELVYEVHLLYIKTKSCSILAFKTQPHENLAEFHCALQYHCTQEQGVVANIVRVQNFPPSLTHSCNTRRSWYRFHPNPIIGTTRIPRLHLGTFWQFVFPIYRASRVVSADSISNIIVDVGGRGMEGVIE